MDLTQAFGVYLISFYIIGTCLLVLIFTTFLLNFYSFIMLTSKTPIQIFNHKSFSGLMLNKHKQIRLIRVFEEEKIEFKMTKFSGLLMISRLFLIKNCSLCYPVEILSRYQQKFYPDSFNSLTKLFCQGLESLQNRL